MANKDPSRTEKATSKKIQDTRKDGNVLQSADILSFGMILTGTLLLFVMAPLLYWGFQTAYIAIHNLDCRVSWNAESFQAGAVSAMMIMVKVSLPGMFFLCLAALVIMKAQVGKFFTLKPLKWKFKGMNPAKGLMKLVPNKDNLIKLLLTMAKITVIAYFVYLTIAGDFEEYIYLPLKPLMAGMMWVLQRCYLMIFKMVTLFAVIAIIDYIVKRKKYYDDLMMTKQEVKDERRSSEGDPKVKAKIKMKMFQLLKRMMMANVHKADVVITNPTHVAVAIRYEPGSYAPIVVAKGLRKMALRIKKLAKAAGVPTVEAPPLARSLYRNTEVNQYIPPEFFGAVATILAQLQKEGKKDFSQKSA